MYIYTMMNLYLHSSCCYCQIIVSDKMNRPSGFLTPALSPFSAAPCAPQSVHVEAQCADGAMAVSWSPNPDAEYFYVEAVSNAGARHYCNSSGTTCTIADLPCGRSYNVSVLSVSGSCEGKPSAVVETSTGNKAPTVVCSITEFKMTCGSDSSLSGN